MTFRPRVLGNLEYRVEWRESHGGRSLDRRSFGRGPSRWTNPKHYIDRLRGNRIANFNALFDSPEFREKRHVVLGFTYDGHHLVSYSQRLNFQHMFQVSSSYSLQLWSFSQRGQCPLSYAPTTSLPKLLDLPLFLHSPSHQPSDLFVSASPLSDEIAASFEGHFRLTITQSSSQRLWVIHGSPPPPEPPATNSLTSHATVFASPLLFRSDCLQVAHFSYESFSPYPPFHPSLALTPDDSALIVNDGRSLMLFYINGLNSCSGHPQQQQRLTLAQHTRISYSIVPSLGSSVIAEPAPPHPFAAGVGCVLGINLSGQYRFDGAAFVTRLLATVSELRHHRALDSDLCVLALDREGSAVIALLVVLTRPGEIRQRHSLYEYSRSSVVFSLCTITLRIKIIHRNVAHVQTQHMTLAQKTNELDIHAFAHKLRRSLQDADASIPCRPPGVWTSRSVDQTGKSALLINHPLWPLAVIKTDPQ